MRDGGRGEERRGNGTVRDGGTQGGREAGRVAGWVCQLVLIRNRETDKTCVYVYAIVCVLCAPACAPVCARVCTCLPCCGARAAHVFFMQSRSESKHTR